MDRVFTARTIKNVKFALASMPQKIDDLYKLTLERIQHQAGDDGPLAMRILGWITHARRPLSVNELQHGLAVEYSDDEDYDLSATGLDDDNLLQPESLVDVCAGLVIIDRTSQIIRLVHYTAQDYFSNKRQDLFAEAEANISRACITYLSYAIGHGRQGLKITMLEAIKAFESHPFLDYASGHWFSHVKSTLSAGNLASSFLNFVARFKCSDSCLRSISLLHWDLPRKGDDRYNPCYHTRYLDLENTLESASCLGLEELVTVLLDHSTGPYPGLNRSFYFASRFGASNVVELLLRYGAQVNFVVDGAASDADTALGIACETGHLPVAKVLIQNGANPYIGGSPAMHAAARANKPIMVDFLLKEGVNVNARDPYNQTALHIAASYDSEDVVKFLLNAHCELDLENNYGCTALHAAARNNSVGIVKVLLDADCALDLQDDHGSTALHYAARNGYVGKVKKLLDAYCNLNLKDIDGCTALYCAARNGHVDIVKKLLDAHCDLNLKDNDGRTTLHNAARSGRVDVVKLLLDARCDLNLKDNDGYTALHHAAGNVSVDMDKLSLDAHWYLYLKNDQERTAQHWAAQTFPELDVIELLLDRGADASAKDEDGRTARTSLEDILSSKYYEPGGVLYGPGNGEKAESLIRRMIQLEQTASAPPVGNT